MNYAHKKTKLKRNQFAPNAPRRRSAVLNGDTVCAVRYARAQWQRAGVFLHIHMFYVQFGMFIASTQIPAAVSIHCSHNAMSARRARLTLAYAAAHGDDADEEEWKKYPCFHRIKLISHV